MIRRGGWRDEEKERKGKKEEETNGRKWRGRDRKRGYIEIEISFFILLKANYTILVQVMKQ